MMKTHNRGTHLVLLLDVEEATWWQQRGFEDDSQDQRGATSQQILQVND